MNKFSMGVILLFLISSVACKRKIVSQTSNFPSTSLTSATDKVEVKNTDFIYFSSKSEFNYKDDNESINAHVILRMKKDSIIWINISPGLGIEAIRAIITPDSVAVVDKIKKQYVIYDFTSLSQKYNFKIDFNLLQNLFLGNMTKSTTDSVKVLKHPGYYVLNQKLNRAEVENYINEKSLKLERSLYSEPGTSNALEVVYSLFAHQEGGQIIPNKIDFSLNYTFEKNKYNVSIDINHQKTEFSEKGLKFPFNIPSKYERRE